MPEETLLAFDYGAKKLGVALGNTLLKQARPLDLILEPTRDGRFAVPRLGGGAFAGVDSGTGQSQ